MALSKNTSFHVGRYSLFTFLVIVVMQFASQLAFASSQPYITDHQINFGTGNKYLSETDVRLSSPAGSFTFARTYNSQGSDASILGYGWTATSTEKLTVSGADLYLTQAGGRVVYFVDDGSGGWINQTGRKRVIASNANGYELTELSGKVKQFNSAGALVSVTDHNGNSRVFSYANGLVETITDNFGLLIDFNYTNEILTSISTPVGIYTYGYTNGNLTSVTKPDTTSIQYIYDDPNDPHNLTGILDESQVRVLTVEYDTEDRVIRSAKAGGDNEVTIAYPSFATRTITDSLQIVTTYQLEVKQSIISVSSMDGPGCSSCGSGTDVSYTYDDRLQILTKTDGNNVVTGYTYDADGNRDSITKAVGTANETVINKLFIPGTNRVQTVTKDSVSNPGQQQVTTFNYYPNGSLWTKIETGYLDTMPISRTTTYTYDPYGRIKTIDGPRTDVNDIITYDYYLNDPAEGANRGHLHTITNAKGHTITYSNYNGYGKAERIKDSNNVVTALTYCPNGLLNTRTTAGVVVDYDYYPDGSLQKVTLPGGRTVNYLYTPSGKVEEITDNLGNKIVYSYDTEGLRRRQDVFDPQNTLTAYLDFDYDDADRLHKTFQPDGYFEQLDYDGANNLVQRINQLTQLTEYGYDELNRLETVTESGITVTAITYDSDNNQKTVTDAEQKVTSFTYDDFGRRLTRTSPDTGLTLYDFDEVDNLTSKLDASNINITYGYDELNRLETISYPDPVDNVTYSYDQGVNGIGRRTGMSDSTGSTSYVYDTFGRLEVETRTQDGIDFTLIYGYNDNNEIIEISYPSGRIVTYNRNSIGNVESVTTTIDGDTTTLASGILYKPFGPMTDMTLGNGVVISNSYDNMYRLQNSSAGTFFDRTYGYYPDSAVQTITDNIDATASQSYTYDTLHRLKTALGKYGNMVWNYDDVGNRLDQTTDAGVINYIYVPGTNLLNQVVGTETTDYLYDNAGNQQNLGNNDLIWSQDNRLVEVNKVSRKKVTNIGVYGYDGRGLRTIRTAGGEAVHSIYGMDGNILLESDDSGTVINEYVYLNGVRLALLNQTVTTTKVKGKPVTTVTDHTFYYISDHLSTAQVMLDDQGTIVWQGNYTPFGEVDVVVNTIENNFRFPGQVLDPETGLYYNWHRFYDPSTGRYISADPIGLAGGMNLYAYVGGNPVNWIDPKGLNAGTLTWGTGIVGTILIVVPEPYTTAIGTGMVLGALATIPGDTPIDEPAEECKPKQCKPCTPPVGTIATDVHSVPPSKPHYPIEGSHVHWFKMNQSPYPACKCFWKRNYQKPTPGNTTPPGTVPVSPATGGGPM